MCKRMRGKSRIGLPALKYAKRLYMAIGTPKALACYLLLINHEYEQLANMDVDPSHYNSALDYFLDAQAVKLLSKYEKLPTGIDTESVALEKFVEAELQCRDTNQRLAVPDPFNRDQGFGSILHRTRRKIAQVVGVLPPLDQLDFRFGPGASTGVRKETSVYNKVTSTLECTRSMLPILGDFLMEFPSLSGDKSERQIDIFEGSELTFVPKNAKTQRPICIEPLLNGLMQKGVGTHLRHRLRRFGINLNDQGVNQKLASLAYDAELSTIDFSSASDTISYMTVLDLFPIEWVEFLDHSRSPSYFYEGNWYDFEKFSSMGNAYTFELETIIFFALACACCEELGVSYSVGENLSVYGDDVIIPRSVYDLFSEVSSHLGFSVNQEKSFHDGPFFESCGCDYYEGFPVRPFYIKKDVANLRGIYYVTNQTLQFTGAVREISHLRCKEDISEILFRLDSLHGWCISLAPKRLRLPVPFGAGDGGFIAPFDVARPASAHSFQEYAGWNGFIYRALRESAIVVEFEAWDYVPMLYALYYAGGSTWCGRLTKQPPDPLDNGKGYSLRNRTKFRWIKSFWPGAWPDCPFWGEKAISMM